MADTDEWHRSIAIEQFNATWVLIDKPDRTADDDVEMLASAMTSRWHWSRVGGPEEIAAGDWQVAHVASLTGLGDLAVRFATRCFDAAVEHGWTGWRLASAPEGMARACAAVGDAEGRARHVAACEAALAAEPEDGERAEIAGQLATVPEV